MASVGSVSAVLEIFITVVLVFRVNRYCTINTMCYEIHTLGKGDRKHRCGPETKSATKFFYDYRQSVA